MKGSSHALSCKLWLLAAFVTAAAGCTLSHGVDLPGTSDNGGVDSGDGDLGIGDGDGDGEQPGSGLGGSCDVGGAGGQAGSAANRPVSSQDDAPPQGGAPPRSSCVVK